MNLDRIIDKLRRCLLLIPPEHFDELTSETGYLPAFLHLLFCIAISIPVSALFLLLTPLLSPVPDRSILFYLPGAFLLAFFGAITTAISLLAFSLLSFALLKIMGGKAKFIQTIQVFIYGMTAFQIFFYVPYAGILSLLLGLINAIRGASRVHKIPLWMSFIALVVIPVFLFIAIILALLLLMILAGYGPIGRW